MSHLFASGGQSVGSSPSAWVLPVNIQDWLPLGLTGLSRVFSFKTSILQRSTFIMVQLSHPYMTTGKTIWAFVGKLCGPLLAKWHLCFLIASRFVTAFLPGSKHFMAAVTVRSDFGAQENKICHWFHFFPFYLPWSDGTGCHDLSFFNGEFQSSLNRLSGSAALLWWGGLHNSSNLWAMPCRATWDRQVTVKSSDKTWSTGGGNDNQLQYSCLENPMTSMKRKKIWHKKDEHPSPPQVRRCPILLLGKRKGQLLIAPERMKWLGQRGNDRCGCIWSNW